MKITASASLSHKGRIIGYVMLVYLILHFLISLRFDFIFNDFPIENHAWRNTQTLTPVENLKEERFGATTFNALGDVAVPFEVPIYQYLVYALSNITSSLLGLDNTKIFTANVARHLQIFCFLWVFLLPLLTIRGLKLQRIVLMGIAIAVLFGIGQTPLIVFSTVPDGLAALFLLAALVMLNGNSKGSKLWGSLLVLVSSLTKITTTTTFVGIYSLMSLVNLFLRRISVHSFILSLLPALMLIIALGFYIVLDIEKSRNPISNHFTMAALSGWNTGPALFSLSGLYERTAQALYYGTRWSWPIMGIGLILNIIAYSITRNGIYILYAALIFLYPLAHPYLFGHNYYHFLFFPFLALPLVEISGCRCLNNGRILIFSALFLPLAIYDAKLGHSALSVSETVEADRQKIKYQVDAASFLNNALERNESFIATGLGYSPVIPYLSDRVGLLLYKDLLTDMDIKSIIHFSGIREPKYYLDCGDSETRKKVEDHLGHSRLEIRYRAGDCSAYKINPK